MKDFYEKKPVDFAVILIVIYVVGMSVGQSISETVGIGNICEAVFCAALSVFIFMFVKKNDLLSFFGLKKPEVSAARMLLYIPLAAIAFKGVIFGVGFTADAALFFRTVKMLFVGFTEEMLFRALLFRGIEKENNLKLAVIISSVTFGLGHIVNLTFNGYEILESVTQIIFALACGFMLVMIYLKTDSIIPCIVFHSINNMMTGFTEDMAEKSTIGGDNAELVFLALELVFSIGYIIYMMKALPENKLRELRT